MKLGGFIEQFGKTEGPGPRTMHKKHPFVEQLMHRHLVLQRRFG